MEEKFATGRKGCYNENGQVIHRDWRHFAPKKRGFSGG
jgi:hypothetical protein